MLAWIGRHLPDFDDEQADDFMTALCVVGTALWCGLALDALASGDLRGLAEALAYVGLLWTVRGAQRAGLRAVGRWRDRAIERLKRRAKGGGE